VVSPWSRLGFARATDTVATGFTVTVRGARPDVASLVAVMLAVPATRAVMTPVDETVATDVAEEDQITVLPGTRFPAPSRKVAVAVVVRPAPRLWLPSETVTVGDPAGDESPQAEATSEKSRASGKRRKRKLGSRVRWAR
jgi:hypothetical protein